MPTEDELRSAEEWSEMIQEQIRTGKKGIDAQVANYLTYTRTGKALDDFGTSTKKATNGLTSSIGSMTSGTGDFTDATAVISGSIKAVAGIFSSIPILGPMIEGLGEAASELLSYSISRTQAGYDSYQQMASAGLIASEGITGLKEDISATGMPLATFSKVLIEHSEDLAYFGGNVRKGAGQFKAVMKSMQDGDDMRMRNLGLSLEEMGDTVINFQKTYQRLGMLQTMSQDQLADSSVKYAKELDMIAKITGQTADEAQKGRDSMLADTRFRAFQESANSKQQKEARIAMGDLVTSFQKMSPAMAEGMKDLFAGQGVAQSKAGQDMVIQGMGPVIKRIAREMQTGNMDLGQARVAMIEAAMQNRDKFKSLSALMGQFGHGIPFEQIAEMARAAKMSTDEIEQLAKSQEAQAAGADGAADTLNRTMKAQQAAGAAADAFAIASPAAIFALESFTTAMNSTIDFLNEKFGDGSSAAGTRQVTSKKVGSAIADKQDEIDDLNAKIKRIKSTNNDTSEIAKAHASIETLKNAQAKLQASISSDIHIRQATDRNATVLNMLADAKASAKKYDDRFKEIQASYNDGDWLTTKMNVNTAEHYKKGADVKIKRLEEELKTSNAELAIAKQYSAPTGGSAKNLADVINAKQAAITEKAKDYEISDDSTSKIEAESLARMAAGIEKMWRELAAQHKLTKEQVSELKKINGNTK